MRLRTVLSAALMLLMATAFALAADVSGKWTGEVEGRNGQKRPVNFTLKADGDKLTGMMMGFQGRENPISDGKIKGNDLSWTVTNETPNGTMKMSYTATLSGDELKVKLQREGADRVQEFTAKRAQ